MPSQNQSSHRLSIFFPSASDSDSPAQPASSIEKQPNSIAPNVATTGNTSSSTAGIISASTSNSASISRESTSAQLIGYDALSTGRSDSLRSSVGPGTTSTTDGSNKQARPESKRSKEVKALIIGLFALVDLNKSKHIEIPEFQDFYTKMGCPSNKVEAEVMKAMDLWDADKDEKLSFKEFYKMNISKLTGMKGQLTVEALDKVKESEYSFFVFRLREMSSVANGSTQLAVDGLERVTQLRNAIQALFDVVDSKHDRYIDRAELRAFYIKMGTPIERIDDLVLDYMGKWGTKINFNEYYVGMMRDVRAFDGIDFSDDAQMRTQFNELPHDRYFAMLLTVKYSVSVTSAPDSPTSPSSSAASGYSSPGESFSPGTPVKVGGGERSGEKHSVAGDTPGSTGSMGSLHSAVSLASVATSSMRYAELRALLLQLFRVVDTNGNAILEKAELQEFYEKVCIPSFSSYMTP